MATEDKSKRKVWTVVEIKGLLKCYLARKEEFLHARKKRNAYAHVLEDMVAQGFTDPSTTPVALEGKMRTLLSAYKCAKDNASRTGAAPCIAPYMDEMEEIFGNSALLSNNHTLNVGRCRAQPLGTPPPPQQADSPQPALPPRPTALSQPPRYPQPSLPTLQQHFHSPHCPTVQQHSHQDPYS
ncbi:uncharacterized protein LOC118732732 [Rhagoletis pomonella]|uniref:uncharacterized protein LOC118732732 n=1 Tax=Rhagoletis pomonella TaxID=28610 RepID=UPI00177ABD7C|nr:uncharacterized protein LOC118732732 [Rhagoletis pomonella]